MLLHLLQFKRQSLFLFLVKRFKKALYSRFKDFRFMSLQLICAHVIPCALIYSGLILRKQLGHALNVKLGRAYLVERVALVLFIRLSDRDLDGFTSSR